MNRKRWLWAVWWLGVLVWAVALTTTFPVHIKEAVLPVDPPGIHVAKVLHVTAYAFLAAFAGWLRPKGNWRWLILLLLLEHGVVTEWVQHFIPERTASVNDILIDHIGVALGVALSWPWWQRPHMAKWRPDFPPSPISVQAPQLPSSQVGIVPDAATSTTTIRSRRQKG